VTGAPTGALRPLTSPRNPWLRLAHALETKRERRQRRLLVAEGEDLLAAALDHGVRPQALLVDADRRDGLEALLARTAGLSERYAVPPRLMARASTLAAAPRVIAILPQPAPVGFREVRFPPAPGMWLAGVGDPGNVGTLVRTAAALGADWLALGPGSADPWNPRAVRAAMGATFAIPLLEGVRGADLATREGVRVVAAVPRGGVPPWEADLEPVLAEIGDRLPVTRVTIPQAEGAESLNVAAAGAALLAEALRQRMTAPRPSGGVL
jgi:TrmH family RNA methyltransferase